MRTSEAFFLPRKIIAIKLLLTLQSIDIKQGLRLRFKSGYIYAKNCNKEIRTDTIG